MGKVPDFFFCATSREEINLNAYLVRFTRGLKETKNSAEVTRSAVELSGDCWVRFEAVLGTTWRC